ncbi:MAG TPA: helix-turn-helix transcriptional regulator [Candidatus Deferrimicrobium sp.]|nr:helix-turn-helix transcriptional regulator [Candidatus Kapabacteria bacterium]HLP58310.1 helix-turn-helix transcriptional regulator [Candidatus Deferrimicrobium sp.]
MATLMRMTESNFAEQVIQFILTRDNEELGDLTILKTARRLNISQSHLYHIFQTEKKIPPGKFLMIAKMLRAAILLEDPGDLSPIKAISKKMGFSSADYFTRVFKEHFGTTPGKYREYARCKNKIPGKIKNERREDICKKKHRINHQ